MLDAPHILFVADGRSPITHGWLGNLIDAGWSVHLASSYPCQPMPGLKSMETIPVALSGLHRRSEPAGGGANLAGRGRLRHWLGPLTVPLAAGRLHRYLGRVQPDVVHALRIPFEGMLAAWTDPPVPLVVSTWGNDFTLHGLGSPGMRSLTQRTMRRADGLHSDCRRDVRLALESGFEPSRPTTVLPGNGGLDPAFFDDQAPAEAADPGLRSLLQGLAPGQPLIVNPRGFRSYVRNEAFFRCLPRVFQEQPAARVACPAMAGSTLAARWVSELALEGRVSLLGMLSAADMAHLLRRTTVSVSPSEHDGTPNSLLEAMACGALPVAGDIESLREWIEDGRNGLLVDPADEGRLAQAILGGLADGGLRRAAAGHNRALARAYARREHVRDQALSFYAQVLADG